MSMKYKSLEVKSDGSGGLETKVETYEDGLTTKVSATVKVLSEPLADTLLEAISAFVISLQSPQKQSECPVPGHDVSAKPLASNAGNFKAKKSPKNPLQKNPQNELKKMLSTKRS